MLRNQVFENLKKYDQGHVLKHFDNLDLFEQNKLINQVHESNLDQLMNAFRVARNVEHKPEEVEPITLKTDNSVYSYFQSGSFNKDYWTNTGYNLIKAGKVALLLLAGGQGSRLGWDQPKGTYPIGPISKMSFFELFALKMQRVAELSHFAAIPPLYVLTAKHNSDVIQNFFEESKYFGLDRRNVYFFEQDSIPAFDNDGKIIMASKFEMFESPNGNGGLVLSKSFGPALTDMMTRELQYIQIVSIDNPLQKILDPEFLGYVHANKAETGVATVERVEPDESIGMLCLKKNKENKPYCGVIEYSELNDKLRYDREKDNRLKFCAGNICNYIFSVNFLNECYKNSNDLDIFKPHIAKKKIPYYNEEADTALQPTHPNGMKVEYLIFDALALSSKTAVFEYERESCFSPLKNKEGECSPETVRQDMSRLHKKWLLEAGAILSPSSEAYVEISPVFSYSGENLGAFKNRKVQLPFHLK